MEVSAEIKEGICFRCRDTQSHLKSKKILSKTTSRIVVCRPYAPGSNPLIFEWIFFAFEIEQTYTLTTFVDHNLSLSQSIINRRMIVWSGWDSSIWKKLLKKISDCRSFSVLKILTGYRPYSRSLYYFPSKFPSVLRGNYTSGIRATSPKFMCHVFIKNRPCHGFRRHLDE